MAYQRGKHTRGINVNTGMDAFERAYGITKGVMADFAKSKAEGEIKTLGSDASAVEGVGLKVGDAEGVVTGQGVDENGNAISAEDAYRQAYARSGEEAPEISTTGTKFAARAGEGKDYGVYDSELAAEAGSRKANHGLMRQKADVYQKHGLSEEAKGLRKEARAGERQDSQDAMALESHNQAMKLGGLQVSAAQAQEDSRKRTEAFNTEFAELEAAGGIKTLGDLRALAAKHKLSPQEQFQLATTKVGLDEAQTKSEVMARVKKFNETYQKGGLAGLKQLYNEDPLFDNGQDIDFVQGKGGTITVVHGGNQVFSGTQQQVAAFLQQEVVDPIKAVSFTMEVGKYQMELRKGEAAIRASDANAAESVAKAGLARRTDPNAGKGGNGNEKLTALTGYANSLNAQIANIDKAISNLDPKDPKAKALAIQRDRAYQSLSSLQQQIETERLGLGGNAPAAAPAAPPWEADGVGADEKPKAPKAAPLKRESEAEVKVRLSAKQDNQARADEDARIEQLRKIIASPTYSISKGLVNNPSGASLQSTKDRAQAELDRILARRGAK